MYVLKKKKNLATAISSLLIESGVPTRDYMLGDYDPLGFIIVTTCESTTEGGHTQNCMECEKKPIAF